MCHVSLAGLPTPGGRRAGATLGNAQSSDPRTPTEFGAWDYVAVFLGLFGGRLRSAQLGSVEPSSVWPCQRSGSAPQECGAAGCNRPGCPCWGGDPKPATGRCARGPVSLSLHFDSLVLRGSAECLVQGQAPVPDMGTFSCFASPGGHFCTPVLSRGTLPALGTGTRAVKLAIGTGAGQHWTRGVGQRGAKSCPGRKQEDLCRCWDHSQLSPRLAGPLQTFSRSGSSMSPQAGDEDGDRDSHSPPGHSSVTACQGDAPCAVQGPCWGPDSGGAGADAGTRGLAGGADMAQLWLSHGSAGLWVPGLAPAAGGECWDRRWAAPRKFVHVGERVTVAAECSGLPRERARPQHTGPRPAHHRTW